jgi:CheY-like chemotaxis protein
MKIRDDEPVKHYIDQILQASERAAALTQGLLAFSRKQPMKIELQELNVVIRNFEKFLHRLLREDIEMTIRYSVEQPVIMADRGQVEQVIMNLVTNARDAMPDRGKLTIDTRVSAIDEAFIRSHGYGKAGDYAMLSVSDTGVGMNKETKERIFEPFFTTKEMGKGTGLGLATVYGIVKAHDGFINVDSELGKGSAFHVYFPLARAANAIPEPARQNPVLLKGGGETILLAEDDVSLRNLTSTVLRDTGYTVIEAEDGNRAVARFNENRAEIKLLILDGIMPTMNGLEAYQEINTLSPNIPCIFMSGYSGEIFARDGLPTSTEFLPKPVKPSDLLSKIREVLDRD